MSHSRLEIVKRVSEIQPRSKVDRLLSCGHGSPNLEILFWVMESHFSSIIFISVTSIISYIS